MDNWWVIAVVCYLAIGFRFAYVSLPGARAAGHPKSVRRIGTFLCIFAWPFFLLWSLFYATFKK
jgi:hypothetical protein